MAPDEVPCAKKIISTLARRAYRRPVNDNDLETLIGFYQLGRNNGGNFEMGIEAAIQRILASPEFIFRFEPDPANVAARHAVSHSAIWNWRRGSLSFSGAAFPTINC